MTPSHPLRTGITRGLAASVLATAFTLAVVRTTSAVAQSTKPTRERQSQTDARSANRDGSRTGSGRCFAPPSPAAIRATVESHFTRTYGAPDHLGAPRRVTYAWIGDVKVGQLEQQGPRPVRLQYRIRLRLDIHVADASGTVLRTVERGYGKPQRGSTLFMDQDELFLFYRDSFGEWDFVVGGTTNSLATPADCR